ncbi:MAG: alpha-2-macroglobulin, partial [Prevotella sp.]|nr:alpha-2-macroglobulin [Prevotella sp.]
FELRDANYKLVSEQTVKTDRYGKCAADFILPTGLLNGRFTIRANNQSAGIQVEEYKRPTFQVDFDDYQEPYQQGDTVRAQGKAVTYAGVPVQGAKVKYTVRRKVAFWWLSYSRYWQHGYVGSGMAHEVVGEGEAVTADDGTFSVAMPMVMPEGVARGPMFYNFVVEADVTDVAGETHQGTLSLPLGTKPTALTCDIPQQVRKDLLPQVTFSRRNAAGKEIAGTVSYRVDGGGWQQCAANAPQAKFASQLKSGEHRLEAVCEQDTVDIRFVVFSLDDTKPAALTTDWFYVSHSQFPNDGGPVTLQVGSSDPALHIVYGIFAGNKLIEEGVVDKDAALVNRKFTYKEAYGNGLLLTYAWVKNGVAYRHQAQIVRPMPEKKLKMTWETFRDRLTPGQQEE